MDTDIPSLQKMQKDSSEDLSEAIVIRVYPCPSVVQHGFSVSNGFLPGAE
jgi:hypothetical protein